MEEQEVIEALKAMTDEQLAAVDQHLAEARRREAAIRTYTEMLRDNGTEELSAAVAAVQETAKSKAKTTKAK